MKNYLFSKVFEEQLVQKVLKLGQNKNSKKTKEVYGKNWNNEIITIGRKKWKNWNNH